MLVNNEKKVPIYALDSLDTVKVRIAATLHTHPDFLVFENSDWKTDDKNVKVIDLLSEAKKADDSSDFEKFLSELPFPLKDEEERKEAFAIWALYNNSIETMAEFLDESIVPGFVEKEYVESVDDFYRIWGKDKERREAKKKSIETRIKTNRSQDKKEQELFKFFTETEGWIYIPENGGKVERETVEMTLSLAGITILEIFNQIALNEKTPMAVCDEYFKILKNFVPPDEWINYTATNTIVLHTFNKAVKMERKKEFTADYTKTLVSLEGAEVHAQADILMERGYLTKDEFAASLLSVFSSSSPVTVLNTEEKQLTSIFFLPRVQINSYIFADLVMNNPIFRRFISIDESAKATKKKTEFGSMLYITFKSHATGKIVADISQRWADISDPEVQAIAGMNKEYRDLLLEKDVKMYEGKERRVDQPYIRVRVKGTSREKIAAFQEIFSKLMIIYDNEKNEIIEFYQRFIPDFAQEKEKEERTRIKFRADYMLGKNYTRTCLHRPRELVDPDEIKQKLDKEEAIQFPRPKNPENSMQFPSDGQEPRYFICDQDDEYPYIGLQVNKKEDSEMYPYLPCCFKTNQRGRPNSNFNVYYNDAAVEERKKSGGDVIKTRKFAKFNDYGVLPPELQKVFDLLGSSEKFLRLGAAKSTSTLLASVLNGLHEVRTTDIREKEQESSQKKYVEKVRVQLAEQAVLARQNMYDFTVEQISNLLKNTKQYMDPRYFVQLLEEQFRCRIFLFNSEQMFLPRFSQAYYTKAYEADSPCVFIYEHMGSESDHALYPQCELIVCEKDEPQYYFSQDDAILKRFSRIAQMLNTAYVLNTPIVPVVFHLSEGVPISQSIDSYGKVQSLLVEFDGIQFTLLTSPMPPLNLPESTDEVIYTTEENMARHFIEACEGTILKVTDEKLYGKIGNIKVEIPLSNNGEKIVPQKSKLTLYNKNKRLARYITEYLFWLFSRYAGEKEKWDIKVMLKFAKKYIQIIPNYKYGKIPKTFSSDSPLMKDGKLVVQDEETLKRLMYVLRLFAHRHRKELVEYKNNQTILHYYEDISDLETFPQQMLLQGKNSVEIWRKELPLLEGFVPTNLPLISYAIYDTVQLNKILPYFYKNRGIAGGKVFLAQNVNSVEKAVAVGVIWEKKGINAGREPVLKEEYNKYSFVLLAYGEGNIEAHDFDREKELKNPLIILGYKTEDGKVLFTVLLNL